MTPFGSVELNIEELSDGLLIRYARHAGWIERILAPALVPVLGASGWIRQEPGLVIGAAVLLVLLVARWAWGHGCALRILPDRLTYSSYFQDEKETLLTDVETIRWLGRYAPWINPGRQEGLYISCRGRGECILPLVTKEQARVVTSAISRKFPEYPVDVPIPGSAWFDALPDMTAFKMPSSTDLDPDKKD